jgi:surface protein
MALVVNGQGKWGILPTPSDFISTWKTNNLSTGSSTATQIKLPLVSWGTYNFVVDWGDGTTSTITTWNAAATTHTYATAGTYTVKIKGICTGWSFNGGGDRLKILSISSWGKLKLGTTQGFFFKGCTNLNLSGITDILDLVGTTNLTYCFESCTALTAVGRINEWDMSSVTNLSAMFVHCVNFNQNLSSWNTQSVTNMSLLFHNTTNFNNGLASGVAGTLAWNTSNVTVMNGMFQYTNSFNCNIGSWDVSKVTTFASMFQSASKFNNGGSDTIGTWVLKTTGTVALSQMFQSAILFNQPLNGWNTQAATNMQQMFFGATNFNNGLAAGVAGTLAWNTSAVTIMTNMFNSAASFNCNIGSWNVSGVSGFEGMFSVASKFNNGGSNTINNWVLKTTGTVNMYNMFNGATIFNQPLNSWNTQAVTNMSYMFYQTINFNQPLNGWNTSGVTNMSYMLYGFGMTFNQDLGNLNISSVTNFSNFMTGHQAVNMSTSNLDATYNGWSSRPVKPNISITFGSAKRTAASTAGRAVLTNSPNLWTITDGGI